MKDDKEKSATKVTDRATDRRDDDKLAAAVKFVQDEIRRCREKYQKIADNDEGAPVMVEGETETGRYCQLMMDPSIIAKIYLKYDFPTWSVLEDDAPIAMWDEIASVCGISSVCSADL